MIMRMTLLENGGYINAYKKNQIPKKISLPFSFRVIFAAIYNWKTI